MKLKSENKEKGRAIGPQRFQIPGSQGEQPSHLCLCFVGVSSVTVSLALNKKQLLIMPAFHLSRWINTGVVESRKTWAPHQLCHLLCDLLQVTELLTLSFLFGKTGLF